MTLYNASGQINLTSVLGTSYVGLYAADGSINAVFDDAAHTGLYHPSGAIRVNSSNGVTTYDASGAYYINHVFGDSIGGAGGTTVNTIVANRTVTPGSLSGVITTPFTFISEHYSTPQGSISNIKTVDVNWYYLDNGTTMSESTPGGTYTMKRYIEYPSGTFTAVNWSASPTVTVADGGQVVSDATTLIIPAATKFWIRTVITAVTGTGVVPQSALPGAPSTPIALGVIDGSVSGDFGNSGSVAASASAADLYKPAAILGTVAAANAKAHILVGDSITAIGQGDTVIGTNGASGPLPRTLDPICAYVKIGRQAMAAADIAGSNTRLQTFIAAIPKYTHVGVFFGTNDFNTRYNRTAAQCSTDCGTIFNLFPNTGVTKYQATVGGNSTSTDGWKSAGNQTVGNQQTQSPTFNASVRAIPAYLNGGFCYDLSSYACGTSDTCKWRVPYQMTTDGTHPNTYAADWIANQARVALFGGSYVAQPETTAFFAAIAAASLPAPSATWLDNYNSLIFKAKANGWWTQVSKLHRYDTYDRGVAKRNLVRNGDHQTESATVSWTTKAGFLTGGTGKLVSTYNPTTAPDGLYAQNSAHLGVGISTNEGITNGSTDISLWNAAGSFFTSRNSGNVAQGRINTSANQATGATVTDSTGRWVMSRTGSTTTNIYQNATSLVSNPNASQAATSATEEVGGLGTNYTNKTITYSHIGSGLSSGTITLMDWDLFCFNNVAQGL